MILDHSDPLSSSGYSSSRDGRSHSAGSNNLFGSTAGVNSSVSGSVAGMNNLVGGPGNRVPTPTDSLCNESR